MKYTFNNELNTVEFMRTSIFCFLIAISVCLAYGQDTLNIPPLLKSNNGSEIKSVADWQKQKKEILSIFEHEMYGTSPVLPKGVKYRIVYENNNAFGGKATQKQINLYLNKLSNPIQLLIYYPNKSKKAPAFLGYNFFGNYTVTNDKEVPLTTLWVPNREKVTDNKATELMRGIRTDRWPIELIIDAGYALVTLYSGDIDPDYDDGFENGIHTLYKNKGYSWGTIAAWSWGLRYVMNFLEKDKRIDSKKVVVIGHSRLGKAALWAGATDERFALVISNNSGCGGAALSRRKKGETFTAINTRFPHWFCSNFKKYNDKEELLPVDQHQLIATIAPRPIYVASADKDAWSDPEGEFQSAFLAGEVYRLFGLKGLEQKFMPEVEMPLQDGQIAYHIRSGKHDITKYDWEQYIRFANKFFK